MHKVLRYVGLAACLLALVAIRFRESALFYDPLIAFYKTRYEGQSLPDMHLMKLLLHIVFRYLLNTGLSLTILWLLFRDRSILTFSGILYAGLLIVLLPVFSLLIPWDPPQYGTLFFVRRFLIQPIPLLLFIPAFYYDRLRNQR